METAANNAKEIAQQDGASNPESVHRVTPPTRGKDTGSTRSKFTGTSAVATSVKIVIRKMPFVVGVAGLVTSRESVSHPESLSQ